MNRLNILFFITLNVCFSPVLTFAQDKSDTLTEELKTSVFNDFKHFKIGFYVDAYLNMELNHNRDTTKIVPLFSNCTMTDQIRLNVAAFEMYYDAEKVRGKMQLQYGDAPNLLAAQDKQWIKNIRQASIGFRISKNSWTDIGFMFTPVGSESAWPVFNQISTASVCAYFEPGAILGITFSYKFSDKVNAGFMAGSPYSLAYEQSSHVNGVFFINYMPLKNLTISYNNMFGNQALRIGEIDNNLLYNDILISYTPNENVSLVGQFDFAFQTNSGMAPDTNKIASMCSGWLQCRYSFLKHFSITGRYEYFYDPDGFLSGKYTYKGKTTGLSDTGLGISIEYKPVKIAYIRMEYKFLHANNGNNVYYSNTCDYLNLIIFTTGVRFY
ncbi:MAG: outer membrane beta-barrel protein [Bacteroidetes bacterium]|nr:outer membrane beta-barrel protein [Bacteroidota bacterium]